MPASADRWRGRRVIAVWKVILGAAGLVCGLPPSAVAFFLLSDYLQVNWFHGDPRSAWLSAVSLALGAALGGGAGFLLGALLDRARARRDGRGAGAGPRVEADQAD